MNIFKLKILFFTATAFCCLPYYAALYAGIVTASPALATSPNESIIAPDGNVTFTASSGQGTVTLDQTSLGCTFQNGTPSYGGSGDTATVAVTFTDAATGMDGGNACTIVVNHTVPSLSGGGFTQCAQEDPFFFTVYVPKITVKFDSDAGDSESVAGIAFSVTQTVTGVPASKVQWNQLIKAYTTLTNWDNTRETRSQMLAELNPHGNLTYTLDTNGQSVQDEGGGWTDPHTWNSPNGSDDYQQFNSTNRILTIGGTNYVEGKLVSTGRDLDLQLRRTGETAPFMDYYWGFQFNNANATWDTAHSPPANPDAASARGDINLYHVTSHYDIDSFPAAL